MSLYQVVLVGPERRTHSRTIRDIVSARAPELGLPPRSAIRFLTGSTLGNLDRQHPAVGIYFGGPTPRRADIRHAEQLVTMANLVIPVVPTLTGFSGQVPQCLSGVNGIGLDAEPMEAVARRVYEGLELLRARRLVFISYRRQEASALAQQLHQALDARCWQSFLDTHTVDRGVDFQPVLWDRMNDADLLVLLDSPNALGSDWVVEEIEKANQLGMGVLQLVWPGHSRDPRTLFATPIYLRPENFRRGRLERKGGLRLKEQALRRVLVEVERLRARSVAARREHLVKTFAEEIRAAGYTPTVQAVDEIEIVASGETHRIYPVVGHVDSVVAHNRALRAGANRTHLLYDPTGLLQTRIDHITWLSTHLPVRNLSSMDVAAWATTL